MPRFIVSAVAGFAPKSQSYPPPPPVPTHIVAVVSVSDADTGGPISGLTKGNFKVGVVGAGAKGPGIADEIEADPGNYLITHNEVMGIFLHHLCIKITSSGRQRKQRGNKKSGPAAPAGKGQVVVPVSFYRSFSS